MPSRFLPLVYLEDVPQDSEAFLHAFKQTRAPNDVLILRRAERARHYFSEVATSQRDIPSLALVNLAFTETPGLDFIEWIRNRPELKTIPIVALAPAYNFDQLEKSYNFGANLYLIKPRNLGEWADLVYRLQGYWPGQSDVAATTLPLSRMGETIHSSSLLDRT